MTDTNNNVFVVSKAHGLYGARIWVNRGVIFEHPTLYDCLNRLSRWGCTDKVSGDDIAWEFHAKTFDAAKVLLEVHGFREGEL